MGVKLNILGLFLSISGAAYASPYHSMLERGQFDAVASQCKRSKPKSVDDRLYCAKAFYKLNDFISAIDVLQALENYVGEKPHKLKTSATTREAYLLLARVYSRADQADRACLILEGFLHDPRTFRKEVEESLRHSDFGWIQSTKDYQTYRKNARKALYGSTAH